MNELGHSYGRIDRSLVRTSDDEGNKVKMTSHSYKFTVADSILDLEYRYILATPEYVRRHAACYNLGLSYPCGLEEVDYVGDDGPALWTWQHSLSEERWSRVGEQPPEPGECQPEEMGDGSTDPVTMYVHVVYLIDWWDNNPEATAWSASPTAVRRPTGAGAPTASGATTFLTTA